MVAATVVTDRLDVNFFSHFWYRGTTRGVEFSFVDVLAIGVLAASLLSPPSSRTRFYWPASFGWMLLFFIYASVLTLCIEPRIHGLLELSKMLRGFLFFLATAMYVRRERELAIFVLALCCAVCLEGGWAFKQRVLGGVDRAPGTLDHANSLSMYLCLVSPVFVAGATSNLPKYLRAFSVLAIAAAAVGILLTVSRAGVPIFALVMLGATAFCVSWRITAKKVAVTALVALCAAGLFLKMWGDLKGRYAEATLKDEYLDEQSEGRGYYLRLAMVIMEDRFFGVGLNNWSYWVSKKYGAMIGRGYDDYDDLHGLQPADEAVDFLIYAAPAHNLAALTVGELGVPGLILFTLLWFRWFFMAVGFLWRRTPEAMQRIGVGIFFSLGGIFLQSITEWTFRQTHIFLTFNALMGVLAALCYERKRLRKLQNKPPARREWPEPGLVESPVQKEPACA
jgi:O-antigen ligase